MYCVFDVCAAITLQFTYIYRSKWVRIKGTKYTKHSCVVKYDELHPLFGIIEDIVLLNGPILILEQLETVSYCKHFHAYEVKKTPVKRQDSLADFHQLGIYQTHDSRNLIPLKYYVWMALM